jgi:hypothetical protein
VSSKAAVAKAKDEVAKGNIYAGYELIKYITFAEGAGSSRTSNASSKITLIPELPAIDDIDLLFEVLTPKYLRQGSNDDNDLNDNQPRVW